MTIRDTDADWDLIARKDPYWGVVSSEEFRGLTIPPDQRERFFQSGHELAGWVVAVARRYFVPDFAPKRTLEFGCGVGRVLIPLARLSGEAVGLDVSESMLELCRKHVDEAGIRNVRLARADDTLSALEGTFDLVNSFIVLQHVPPQRGMAILRRLLDRLRPGGIAALQLTYAKARRFLAHEEPRAQFYRRDGNMLVDLAPKPDAPPPGTVSMYEYDLNSVFAVLAGAAMGPLVTFPTDHSGHIGVHVFLQRADDGRERR